MTTSTKTQLAIILRYVAMGIYTKAEAYDLINKLYMQQLNNHNF